MHQRRLSLIAILSVVLLLGCASNVQPPPSNIQSGAETYEEGTAVYDFDAVTDTRARHAWKVKSALVYNDSMYFSTEDDLPNGTARYRVHVASAGGWQVFEGGGPDMREAYNDRFYGFGCEGVCEYGEGFAQRQSFKMQFPDRARVMKAYGGRLYVGTESNGGVQYYFDGSAWRQFKITCTLNGQYTDNTGLISLEMSGGRLFGGVTGCDDSLFVLQGMTWYPAGRTSLWIRQMKEFNRTLFMSDGFSIYDFDGTTISKIRDQQAKPSLKFFPKFVVHKDMLYYYSSDAKSAQNESDAQVIRFDGGQWTAPEWAAKIRSKGPLDRINFLISYQDMLYAVQDKILFQVE